MKNVILTLFHEIQAQPSKKFKKTCTSSKSLYQTDQVFPKIDNLEYFPEKVLLQIFASVDDVGLLNLAEISNRFASISKVTFNERYVNEYFKIVGKPKHKIKECQGLVDSFGSGITAIEVIDMRNIDESHWIARFIHKNVERIRKFIFTRCKFDDLLGITFDWDPTHLKFIHCSSTFGSQRLSEFTHLRHFEDHNGFIGERDYCQIIGTNPQLEILIIECDIPGSSSISNSRVLSYAVKKLKHLKQLHVVGETNLISGRIRLSVPEPIEQLESLGLSTKSENLLRQFSSNCPNIKSLKLNLLSVELDDAMIEAIQSFANIEKIFLNFSEIDESSLINLVGGLTNSIELFIEVQESLPLTNDYISKLVRECYNLRGITIDTNKPTINHGTVNMRFYCELLEIMQNRQDELRIELKTNGKTKAILTKEEIVKDGMRIYWAGCEAYQNRSNVHFLDLLKTADALQNQKKQPFDKILDYLNVDDQYSLYQTSLRCQQMVENYMKNRYQEKRKPFNLNDIITDKRLVSAFGKYMTNITIRIYWQSSPLWKVFNESSWQNVILMSLIDHSGNKFSSASTAIVNSQFNFPNLEYFRYSSRCSEILSFDISKLTHCSNLKRIDFMSNVRLINNDVNTADFGQLKTIKFLARNHSIDKFLNSLNTNIERNVEFLNDENQPRSSKLTKTMELSDSSESEIILTDSDAESDESSDFNESYGSIGSSDSS